MARKIGIISLFDPNGVNYGNILQAYALNTYLKSLYPSAGVVSLHFSHWDERRIVTKKRTLLPLIRHIVYRVFLKLTRQSIQSKKVAERHRKFIRFIDDNASFVTQKADWEYLINSDFDVFIVGSDIVWGQAAHYIASIRFLQFTNRVGFKKIAYAASFGKDWIPDNNREQLQEMINHFDAVSVREKSSVEMLKRIGVSNAVHTLDPTLLIDVEHWKSLEEKPQIHTKKYVFVYLLGKTKRLRKDIRRMVHNEGLQIVNIPYATGTINYVDACFGDEEVMDCSPREWLWLIHHAEFVVTDSFHGIVFSTIFEKKFIAVTRHYSEDINNRLIDYLGTIEQKDKLLDLHVVDKIGDLTWNYDLINKKLGEKIVFSEKFLEEALSDE